MASLPELFEDPIFFEIFNIFKNNLLYVATNGRYWVNAL